MESEIGDVAKGFEEADEIYRGSFSPSGFNTCILRPIGSIAWKSDDGRIHIRTDTQTPHLIQEKLAYVCSLDPRSLHVFSERVGGGFGAKQEMLTERSLRFGGSEDRTAYEVGMDAGRGIHRRSGRHPYQMRVKLGARRDGTLTAIELARFRIRARIGTTRERFCRRLSRPPF